jgi:hypothetical protein
MMLDQKIQQFFIQFACRIPTRKELTAAEKNALENTLKTLDPELFQLPDGSLKNSPVLFQVVRQYVIDAITITVPSFVLSNDGIALICPVKVNKKVFIKSASLFDTGQLNSNMCRILTEIQQTVSGLKYQRAGKIFDLILGPFSPTDKENVFKKLFSFEVNDVGEIQFSFARYLDIDRKTYNIKTSLHFQQLDLQDSFQLGVRVDINNRQLTDSSLEPIEVQQIWKKADEIIREHLERYLMV